MTKVKAIRMLGFGAFLAPAILFGVGVLPHVEPSYALSSPANGSPAPDFTAVGSDGARHRLSDYRGSTVVLEWTSPVCEFTAQQYGSGSMQALQAYAAEPRARHQSTSSTHQAFWFIREPSTNRRGVIRERLKTMFGLP